MAQTKTKNNNPSAVFDIESSGFVDSVDTGVSYYAQQLVGTTGAFDEIAKQIITVSQSDQGIKIIQESSLVKRKKDSRILALEGIAHTIKFINNFGTKEIEYNGYLIKMTAEYTLDNKGINAQIASTNGHIFELKTKKTMYSEALEVIYKEIDKILIDQGISPIKSTDSGNQAREEAVKEIEDAESLRVKAFLSILEEGQEVWWHGKKCQYRGLEQSEAWLLIDGAIERVNGAEVLLEPPAQEIPRSIGTDEQRIIDYLLDRPKEKIAHLRIAEEIGYPSLAVVSYLSRLVNEGKVLRDYDIEEEDYVYYCLAEPEPQASETEAVQEIKSNILNFALSDLERELNKWITKPKLDSSSKTAVILFAGYGGDCVGLVSAGVKPVVAVEFNPHPSKQKLTDRIADNLQRNFEGYGTSIIRKSVQQVQKEGFSDFPETADILVATPSCANFSERHGFGKTIQELEKPEDIECARAVSEAIKYLQPAIFSLENVRKYIDSQSFQIITTTLQELGYYVDFDIHDLSNYGYPLPLPQSRERLYLWACRTKQLHLPQPYPQNQKEGWYDAIAHLELPDCELCVGQQDALEVFLDKNPKPSYPLLITRTGRIQVKESHEQCNTLTRSIFTDQNQANRSKVANVVYADGTVKSLTIEAFAILQGFPDWYKFPDNFGDAGTGIGYSFPPSVANHFYRHFVSQMTEEDWNFERSFGMRDIRVEYPSQELVESVESSLANLDDINIDPIDPEPEDITHYPVLLEPFSQEPDLSVLSANTLELDANQRIKNLLPDYEPGNSLTDWQSQLVVNEINNTVEGLVKNANWLRFCIKVLEEGRGYITLGYKTMSALFKSGILNKSLATCQKEWQALKVERELGLETGTLPQTHGLKLYSLIKEPENMKQAYAIALQEAEDQETELKDEILSSAIAQFARKSQPQAKPSECRFVQNGDGSRRYEVVLPGVKVNLHGVYDGTAVELRDMAAERKQLPEEILSETMLDAICELAGLSSRQAVINWLVERAKKQDKPHNVAA